MAKQATGSNSVTVIDFETNYSINPTTKHGKIMPFNKNSMQSKQSMIDPQTITGTRNQVEPAKGNIDVSGSMTIPVDLDCFGYWLKGCFGSPTSTVDAVDATLFTHNYKILDNQPSMVIEKQYKDINQNFVYNGCKINNLKMSFGGDGELTADFDFVGAKETISTTKYDASQETIVLNRLSNFQASIEENGTELAIVTSGDLSINFGLDTSQYLIGGMGYRGDVLEGAVKAEGSLKVLFQDTAFLDKAKGSTKSTLKIKFKKDTQSLEFVLPEIIYDATSPSVDGRAGITLDVKFQAFLGTDSNKSSVMVNLVNHIEKY